MGPFPLQLAQRYVAPHRVHYRSLSQRSAAVVEMPLKFRNILHSHRLFSVVVHHCGILFLIFGELSFSSFESFVNELILN